MKPTYAGGAALGAPSWAPGAGPGDDGMARPGRAGASDVALAVRTVRKGPMVGLLVALLLLGALAGSVGPSSVGLGGIGWAVGVASALITNAALARGLSRYRCDRLRPADWVTLARATVSVAVAALVADSFVRRVPVMVLVSLASLALALDALDGWVARRTTSATFGARFDGEVDAFLILILSAYVARFSGAWVLAIGAARYAFLAAGWPLRWMRAPLPLRDWRKVVTATQGIVLTGAAAGVLPLLVDRAALGIALALLAESFGRDVWWLWRRRRSYPAAAPAVAVAPPGHGRARTIFAGALTALAAGIVWAALVAPNQSQDITLTGFLRVPLEGVVLVALAVVLPSTPRRVLATTAGPAIALLVIFKILDLAFFSAFARPFDLVGDAGDAGIGIETMRAALGHTEADLLVFGGVALAVALLVLMTLALRRLTRVAAANRRRSLSAVAGLGAVWALCWVSGAQLLAHTPVASTSAASYVVHEVGAVQADLRDAGVFANQIKHDPFRNTPASQLLTGLRGKDVLLVFVESYGRVSVQDSSFSPAIDDVLNRGTNQLKSAGFSAASAFVTSPGFGGISWLAHSTLQSGVSADNQRRYDQLVGTDRFTLSDAFDRAGWRTINFAPADDRSWPEGSSFYHYEKLYDRRGMGYRGPGFNYAPMPDQYMFAALERLELAKAARRPLFAEVDTVSSHMPWDRIPRMVPWNDVGDGSIFNRIPIDREPSSFWWHPDQVKAAYARSLEYSLNTLISFVQRYGKKNLVLVVVGDEQPLAIVSGHGASHDVPVSVIAHDPSVFRRTAGWGWQPGLLPSPHAPTWPMSAFRNRFLTAFGSRPTTR